MSPQRLLNVCAIAAAMLVSAGCASTLGKSVCESEAVSDLSIVFEQPLELAGEGFCGEVIVFWPERGNYIELHPVEADLDLLRSEDSVSIHPGEPLPGEGDEFYSPYSNMESGDRILIRARIEPEKDCFEDFHCTPWSYPVFFEDFEVLHRFR